MLWYGCTVDITALQAAQQALQDVNDSLEQRIARRTAALASANEALEAFTYSVAHDLRAPLQVIDGFSRVLGRAMREGDLDRAQSYNERVIANATRMNALIDAFLALSRAGREPLQEGPVDVGAMVRELLAEQPGAARAEVQVGPLPQVTADEATLRQTWFNLISNAFKYSARRERPSIAIGYAQEGAELVFHVRDNGAGFDPAYAGKLFSPFHRLHRADEFEGTGVGLALVRRIVEGHGGRVWAEAKPDAGATFYFTLPRARLISEEKAG
jgi:light-regulated signal transduction histidine kinase (bacteriophytochrome)